MKKDADTQTLYRIEFDGAIQEGQELDEVKAGLCALFRTEDRGRIDRLFQNTPKILKKNLSEEQARKYQRAFEQTGACCQIVPEQQEARTTAPPGAQAPSGPPAKALASDTREKSRTVPGIPGIIIGTLLSIAGLLFLFLIGTRFWNEVRTYTGYQEGLCTIVSQQILEYDNDGVSYEPSFEFHVRTIDGEELSNAGGYAATSRLFDSRNKAEAILGAFDLEETYGCWYDPEAPSKAVLTRRLTFKDLRDALLPLFFAFLGGALALAGVSSVWKDARQRGMSGESKIIADKAPATPSPSSGSQQGFVPLKSEKQHFDEAVMATVLALVLDGIGLYLIVAVALSAIQGKFFFSSTVYALLFASGGYFASRWAFREWNTLLRAGKTRLEVYGGALLPGRDGIIRIHHSGQDRIRAFRVSLKGFEKIRYQKGTDTINEEWLMHEQRVMQAENLSLSAHKPLQQECTVSLAPGAMHSFAAEHNEIAWNLVVSITPEGGSEVKKVFTVQVAPA